MVFVNIKEGFDEYIKRSGGPKDSNGNIIPTDSNGNLLPSELSGMSIIQCGTSTKDPPPFYRFDNNTLYPFPSRDNLKQYIKNPTNTNIRKYYDSLLNSYPDNVKSQFHSYFIKNSNDCKIYTDKYPIVNTVNN